VVCVTGRTPNCSAQHGQYDLEGSVQETQKVKAKMTKMVHSPNSQCSEDPMGVSTPLSYNGTHITRTSIHSNSKKTNNQLHSEEQHKHTMPNEPATLRTPHLDQK
jgi:hypothetical protein